MGYPKGIVLNSKNVLPTGFLKIPEGIDFVIVDALVNMKAEAGFNKHVQEAYNANIPCLARVDVDPKVYSNMFSLAAPKWDDTNFIDPHLAILDKLFLTPAKTSIYVFEAVILDLRFADATNSGAWISQTAWYLRRKIQERYFGIPVYILTDSKVITLYPDSGSDPQVFFSNQKMLCTQSSATLNSIGAPIIPEATGSPKPNWQGIKFWFCGSTVFSFLAGCASTMAEIVQYRASLGTMFEELNYTPKIEVPDIVVPPPDVIVAPPDAEGGTLIVDNRVVLERIAVALEKLAGYITRP